MTGFFARFEDGEEDPRHDRPRLNFAGGEHLAYADQRLLGRVDGRTTRTASSATSASDRTR